MTWVTRVDPRPDEPFLYAVLMTDQPDAEGYTLADRLARIDTLLQMLISAVIMNGPDPKRPSKIYTDDKDANLVDDAYTNTLFFAENWRASQDAGGDIV